MTSLVVLVVLGCGGTPPRAYAPVTPHVTVLADAGVPVAGDGSSEVEIGLDLRALPANTSTSGIDMFVLGQGDVLRRLAPAGVSVEIRRVVGAGYLYARFIAPDQARADAACAQVAAAFLADAPRLAGSMESAADVIAACHTVPPAAAP